MKLFDDESPERRMEMREYRKAVAERDQLKADLERARAELKETRAEANMLNDLHDEASDESEAHCQRADKAIADLTAARAEVERLESDRRDANQFLREDAAMETKLRNRVELLERALRKAKQIVFVLPTTHAWCVAKIGKDIDSALAEDSAPPDPDLLAALEAALAEFELPQCCGPYGDAHAPDCHVVAMIRAELAKLRSKP
jgi:hypothetical protein